MRFRINKGLLLPILILGVSFIFALLTAFFESSLRPELWNFTNIVWWWLSTITTVGYGDIFPITELGKISGGFVMLSSFAVLGIVVTEFSHYIRLVYNRDAYGYKKLDYTNHIVIVGQNPLILPLITYIRSVTKNHKIVIITEDYSVNRYDHADFIHGDARHIETLRRANMDKAKIAIIMADEDVNNPDALTLVIANEIENLNSKIITLGEMVDKKFQKIFEEANIDFFISESEMMLGINDETRLGQFIRKSLTK